MLGTCGMLGNGAGVKRGKEGRKEGRKGNDWVRERVIEAVRKGKCDESSEKKE